MTGRSVGTNALRPGRLLLAVLPTAGLAFACALPLLQPSVHFLWLDRRLLAMVMEIEWLVLAMGMFFVFPMMMPGHTRGYNTVRWIFFGLILWGAGVFAKSIGHWSGVAHYLGLVWVTYAGTMVLGADFNRDGAIVLGAIGRWVVQLAIFAVLYVSLDLGTFHHANDRVLVAGMVYFGLQVGLDLAWFRWVGPRTTSQTGRATGGHDTP